MKNLLKKILVICGIIGVVSATVSFISTQQAFADGFTGKCRSFLGFTSWDCNVDISNEQTLKSGIWTIVANIATDITVAAAYLILGYVIYGGYLYIFSQGDPGKVATGKKALTQAFIGLAIVMSANVIFSSIRIALAADFTKTCTASGQCVGLDTDKNTAGSMIINMIQWVVGIGGLVAAIFIIYGGASYMTSSGDPGKIQKAKQIILYALIGLIVVGLAEVITAFISNMIREADKTALIETRKEYYENQEIS